MTRKHSDDLNMNNEIFEYEDYQLFDELSSGFSNTESQVFDAKAKGYSETDFFDSFEIDISIPRKRE